MYTVIGKIASRTFRVLWVLEELGLDYTHIDAAPQSDIARQYNPLGKIPVLLDGDVALTDSVAIMTYLADKHAGLTAPAGTIDRAKQDALMAWLMDELDASLWMAAKHSTILPNAQRVSDIVPFLHADFAKKLNVLEQSLTGAFLCGADMTIVDIMAVHCINWAIGAKFPVSNDAVNAYAKRLRSRPAFRDIRSRIVG